MKLLMFGMSSYPGGTENYIRNIFFNESVSERISIDFITYEEDLAYSDEMQSLGYRVLHVPHLKRKPLGYFKAVSRIMRSERYDAVYVNMLCAANPLPIYFAKANKTPQIILHAHSNSTVKGAVRGILHKLCRGYCDRAATLRLACSQDAAKWLFDQKNTACRIEIIPNAIDTEKYSFSNEHRTKIRESFGIGDELLLGSVGRLAPEKNDMFMLDILRCISDRGIPARLMLIGDGALRPAIEERIRELDLSDKVILTGTVIDPYKFYSAFDRFLFPSLFEGFGISALEAQSCGARVFCSDTLSRELDVTGSVRYLPLSQGAGLWADEILKDHDRSRTNEMNSKIEASPYNIKNQRERVMELIYGK